MRTPHIYDFVAVIAILAVTGVVDAHETVEKQTSGFTSLKHPWLTADYSGLACDSILDTFVYTFGPRNIQMFGAGLRSLATNAQDDDLYDLGYRIEIWGESLELGVQHDIGGGLTVGRIILAGEAARQFELEGVDPYTAHVAAHTVVAPAMVAFNALGLSPEDAAKTDIHKHMAHYLANDGTIEDLTLIMNDTIIKLMAAHLADNPDPAGAGNSVPEESIPDVFAYSVGELLVVYGLGDNITVYEFSPP